MGRGLRRGRRRGRLRLGFGRLTRGVWRSGLGRNRSRRARSLLVVNGCEIEGGGDVPR